jgi:hypothetical protein
MINPIASSGMLISVLGSLRRAMSWWVGELAGLMPRKWRDRDKARIEARVDERGVELRIHGLPDLVEPGRLEASGILPEALAKAIAQARKSLPVWVLPLTGAVLSRSVQVPRSAFGRFEHLVATEAERWTSFPADEIYLGWRLRDDSNGKVTIALSFVPRAAVDVTLRKLQANGLEPSLLVLNASEKISVPLLSAAATRGQRARRVSVAAAVLAGLTCLTIDWLAAAHEREALRQQIAFERQQFSRQRDLESKIVNVLAASSDSAGQTAKSRNEFLVSVSGAMPPTDWLTEVAIRATQITLRGYTMQPEALIKALEPLSQDRTVMLQGELSIDKKLNRNRFTVVLQQPRRNNE